MGRINHVVWGCLRGAALFFGAFSALNAVPLAVGSQRAEDLWWVDLSYLPGVAGGALGATTAILLLWLGFVPRMKPWRRIATLLACVFVSMSAAVNITGFYRAWGEGSIVPGVPLPFSAVIAVVFALMALAVWRVDAPEIARRFDPVLVGVVAVLFALAFPLAQVAFFGTTDYRRIADVAVVLGAKVHDTGVLSQSLEDRVQTGVELYRSGEVRYLLMSGGIEPNGIDETVAMRDRAMALGVPAKAILMDNGGVDTDSTVRDTVRIFDEVGATRVLVVSQFYHLPRIKLAYRAAGWNVRTVPAQAGAVIGKTPLFVAREVAGFWVYWARAMWRDVRA